MDGSADLVTLLREQKWGKAEALLTERASEGNAAIRLDSALELCTVLRRNGKFDLARQTIQKAFRIADVQDLPTEKLFLLAENLEQMGELALAQKSIARVTDQNHTPSQIMARRLAIATSIKATFGHPSVGIVALGQVCLPDDVALRWGLGDFRVDGPFRAAVVAGNGAAIAIEDDFFLFNSCEAYRVDRTQSGYRMATLPKYGFVMNHETGDDWLDHDLVRLRQFYSRRIENFRRALGKERLLFIGVRAYGLDIARLWQAVSLRANNAKKRMLVIDPKATNVVPKNLPDGIRLIQAVTPFPVIKWFLPHNRNSTAGFVFEKAIVDAIIEEIELIER